MFTLENTSGYSQNELDNLNEVLAEKLENIEDEDHRAQIEQDFSDFIARNYS